MRKFVFTLLSAGLFFLISQTTYAQCNPEELTKDCIPKLADGFNYLKSYKINGNSGAKEKVEYSYVFTKGTQYMINLCAPGEATDGIIVNLYDSKRNKVVSSKIDDQFVTAIVYPCNNTGIYYIQYTFDQSNAYCGGSTLGFKR